MVKTTILFLLLLLGYHIYAQPLERFYGGPADGFYAEWIDLQNNASKGGTSDGFTHASINDSTSIYHAGSGDGFVISFYTNSGSVSKGSSSDGYSSSFYNFSGSISKGGVSDGFSLAEFLYYHKWTGSLSSKWIDPNNWENGIVPDDGLRALIPAGASNYPVNFSGTLTVGNGTGDFQCRDLKIEQGAQIRHVPGASAKIFGDVEISGLFIVEDTTPEAFQVFPGGNVVIKNGGELRLVP